jgi:hypothetical protein
MLRLEAGRRLAHDEVVEAVAGREEASEEARRGRAEDWMMRCDSDRVWYMIWRSIVQDVRCEGVN